MRQMCLSLCLGFSIFCLSCLGSSITGAPLRSQAKSGLRRVLGDTRNLLSLQLLTEKIEEFKWQKNEYDKLVAENQQLNCYKRNILMLEQEKRELESKLAVISSTRRSATPDTDFGADDLKSQVSGPPAMNGRGGTSLGSGSKTRA